MFKHILFFLRRSCSRREPSSLQSVDTAPCVKSLQPSYTGLYPQTIILLGVVSPDAAPSRGGPNTSP